ncbi:hypothetical protein [Halomontanus rarus]|uniref:hypothetical protein n=1 Tax=Halomontanus rarus TaxID=3034020 RepID=UPI0023E8D719|nr:hypothetical protein [Halovivax sp. TS33]
MFNNTRLTSLALVALMLLSVVAMGAGTAAAETTTLNGDGTDEVTGFAANNSNDIANSIASDGTDFTTDGTTKLFMNVTYDGEQYALTEEDVSDGTSASQTVNISNDELSDLPGDATKTTNVTVTTWGEDSGGNVTTATSEFFVDFTFDNTYSATTADDNNAELEEDDGGLFSAFNLHTLTFGAFGEEAENFDLHTYDQTVGIDGSNTTVTVNDATSNGTDAFDDAMGEDKESGDLIYGAAAAADDAPVLAFYDSADEDIVDAENDTYAVYDSSSGVWTFNAGEDQAGQTQMDVFVSSQSYTSDDLDYDADDLGDLFKEQADMGARDLGSAFGWGSLTTFYLSSVPGLGMIASGGSLFAGLFVVGRPQTQTAA